MTLLIVVLGVTNIALGYALAIYLGQAGPLWVIERKIVTKSKEPTAATPVPAAPAPEVDGTHGNAITRGAFRE